jgi:hypothetical protein
MSTSFKGELLNAVHQFGSPTIVSRTSLTSPTADSFKVALYVTTATINAATTVYSSTNEVSGANYTAGGVAITAWNAPTTTGTTAFTTPTASFAWTTVTLATAFDCANIYNATQGNKSVSSHTFGSTTITAGNFTLTMPTNDATNGLLRIA